MTDLLVRDLQDKINSSPSVPTTAYLSSVEITDDTVDINGVRVEFDMKARHLLSELVGAPSHYIKKLPVALAGNVLNHHLNNTVEDAQGTFQTFGENLLAVSDPDKKSLSLPAYLQAVANVFLPTDEVATFEISDKNELLVDVLTSRTVEVPGFAGSERRPQVGDITSGGLRLMAFPDADKPPVVSTYMRRLVCSNGMSIIDPASKISLRGKDEDGLFSELEGTMQKLLGDLSDRMDDYFQTASIPVEGDRSLLIYNMANERNLPRKAMERVMDLGSELPSDASVYDLLQVFTEVANEQPRLGNQIKLQEIGGQLAVSHHSGILHRCGQCERPLVNFDNV